MNRLNTLPKDILDALCITTKEVIYDVPIPRNERIEGITDLSKCQKDVIKTQRPQEQHASYVHTIKGTVTAYEGVNYGFNHISLFSPSNALLSRLKNHYRNGITFYFTQAVGKTCVVCEFEVTNNE